MSWNPAKKVIDVRLVVDNLFDYFEDNQTDAILWANEGAGLADIEKFYKSAAGRLTTMFPTLMLIRKGFAETGEDVLEGALSLTFGCMITGSDTDRLVEDAHRYDMAIRSMLANISSDELTDSSLNLDTARLDSVESEFDSLRQHKTDASMFLQMFQIEAVYMLTASYH